MTVIKWWGDNGVIAVKKLDRRVEFSILQLQNVDAGQIRRLQLHWVRLSVIDVNVDVPQKCRPHCQSGHSLLTIAY